MTFINQENKPSLYKSIEAQWNSFFQQYCILGEKTQEQIKKLCEMCDIEYDEKVMAIIQIQEKDFKNRLQQWCNSFIYSTYFTKHNNWLRSTDEEYVNDTVIRAQEIVEMEKKLMAIIESKPGCKKAWNDILLQLRLSAQ